MQVHLIERQYESHDWITVLFLVAIACLAIAKTIYPKQFEDFVKLIYSGAYLKGEEKGTELSGLFNLLLYASNIIVVSLFIYLILSTFQLVDIINPTTTFTQIAVLYTLLFSTKSFIEKMLGDIFKIDSIINHYLFSKVAFRNYLALCLLPICVFLIYAISPNKTIIIGITGVFLFINLFFLIRYYQKNHKLISRQWFYFILYLCAFEIAPYLILYKAVKII